MKPTDLPIQSPEIKDIASLVENQLRPDQIGNGKPFLILRDNQKVEDIERLLERPTRKTGAPQFTRCASFIDYVNGHKTEASRIYIPANGEMIAVLDHHGEAPGWSQHRPHYAMKASLEWQAWIGKDKQKMLQKDFCDFIEDNRQDIVDQTQMIELIRTLQVNTNVDYKGYEKGDGANTSLQFIKTAVARAGERGELELPDRFAISIPVFEGGEKMRIEAKLRFDIGDGKLKLWFELQQIQRILNQHTNTVAEEVAKQTGIVPFFGTP